MQGYNLSARAHGDNRQKGGRQRVFAGNTGKGEIFYGVFKKGEIRAI